MTKDEALKMAIEAMDLYDYTGTQEESDLYTKAQKACKEALEQPAQAITEGSQLSNIKVGSKSEKPSSPPAPKHTCTYSKTMNQEYPRKCIHCGEVEALAQPAQEPDGWYMLPREKDIDGYFTVTKPTRQQKISHEPMALYYHPAPSWQGLNGDEIEEVLMNYEGWGRIDFARAIEQALKEKNT